MAIVLRMKRMGKNKSPFFRIVAADKRRSVKGGKYIEELGYYNPTKNPAIVKIDKEKVDKWIKRGAAVSLTLKSILKKMEIK